MRVFKKTIEELLHALVDGHIFADRASQLAQLILRGKLTVKKKMHDLEETALLGKLFDRISPVF